MHQNAVLRCFRLIFRKAKLILPFPKTIYALDFLLLKISASKGYCLGPHAYLWAKDGKFNYNLVKIIAPILKWLNKTTGKATSLANIVSDDKYLLHYYEGDMISQLIHLPATNKFFKPFTMIDL